jgi:hypothetical protein
VRSKFEKTFYVGSPYIRKLFRKIFWKLFYVFKETILNMFIFDKNTILHNYKKIKKVIIIN